MSNRMCGYRLVAMITIALALTMTFASRAWAACPDAGPYCIDGDGNATTPPSSGAAGLPYGSGQINIKDGDSIGGDKELSANNLGINKIYSINNCVPSQSNNCLAFESVPSKTDLNMIAFQVKQDPNTSNCSDPSCRHQWFYFSFVRYTTQGSGFFTIELQKNKLGSVAGTAGCVGQNGTPLFPLLEQFTGPNFQGAQIPTWDQSPGYPSSLTTALANGCNPWAGRQAGDIMLGWAQTGNAAFEIHKLIYCATTATCGGAAPAWIDTGKAASAVIGFSADGYTGEAAIDLTQDVFPQNGACTTFATTLANTVTGAGTSISGQANADYKDSVLFPFPPITNCGLLTVKKVTVDPNGKAVADSVSAKFGYTVNRSSGLRVRPDVNENDPIHSADDGPAPLYAIVRPSQYGARALNGCTVVNNVLTCDVQTHTDLVPGPDYQLVEASPLIPTIPPPYQLLSIICTDASGPHNITASGTFTISIPDGTKQTDCVITNQLAKGTPFGQSQQYVRLSDIIELFKILPGAPDASSSTLTVKLYSGGSCDAKGGVLLQTFTPTLQTNADGTGTVNGDAAFPTGGYALPSGSSSPTSDAFSWRLIYSGDSFNDAFDVCNESATIALTDQRPYNVQK